MSEPAGDMEVVWEGSCAVVALLGAHTAFTAPLLRRRLADALDGEACPLVVDTTDASDVDATTLGVLLGLQRRVPGRSFVLVVDPNPGSAARLLLARTGLEGVLRVVASRAEALAFSAPV